MRWLRRLGARFRLDMRLVCEESRGRGLLDDYHDYCDAVEQLPMHFAILTCARYGSLTQRQVRAARIASAIDGTLRPVPTPPADVRAAARAVAEEICKLVNECQGSTFHPNDIVHWIAHALTEARREGLREAAGWAKEFRLTEQRIGPLRSVGWADAMEAFAHYLKAQAEAHDARAEGDT